MPFNEKYINIKKLAQAEINFIEKYMVQCINVREPLNSHIISDRNKYPWSPSLLQHSF